MKKITIAISEELERELEKERKERKFESIPEVVRVVLSDYFRQTRS
ncbi:MAG: ribbon-helix-helix protein, CopG family [Thaumarchaeota archaeon]|nr:ribbon-helix-helix protein, CopG family [Nitrososphaerota archaeon]MDE1841092.1 ribbon-helix-helix protein, CopG family [Nitrososphaerota archaeon]